MVRGLWDDRGHEDAREDHIGVGASGPWVFLWLARLDRACSAMRDSRFVVVFLINMSPMFSSVVPIRIQIYAYGMTVMRDCPFVVYISTFSESF